MEKFNLILVFLNILTLQASELPAWHMKPFGSHLEPNKVDESFADNLISAKDFAEKYVLSRKPIVLRGVVKQWPAFELWTDEYLSEKYGDMEMRIEGKKEKHSGIPKGDVCLGRDRLKTFLSEYKKGANKYVVSELPTPMWGEVKLPACASCGELVRNMVEIDVWMNSDTGKKGKGGSSIIHKDAFNTMNCVLKGKKEWKLVELQYNDYMYQAWEGPMDRGYGGYSLINPDKVNAKRFPNVGEIPRWQFTTINEGDCFFLPSQMWHQVKSYGVENRAVAFLFSQFTGRTELNTTDCKEKEEPVFLSDVDVDLQYPGTGVMYMGHNELESVMAELRKSLVSKKKGYVTKKRVYTMIIMNHDVANKVQDKLLHKARSMYEHFLELAGGIKENMNQSFVDNLKRHEVRPCYKWMFPTEPSNSYEHEYSNFSPGNVAEIIQETLEEDKEGKLKKENLIKRYVGGGGTEKFAQELWDNLAGEGNEETDAESMDLKKALKKYEDHQREDPDNERDGDDDVIVTPQGHKSRPKSEEGGYGDEDKEEADVTPENPKDEL